MRFSFLTSLRGGLKENATCFFSKAEAVEHESEASTFPFYLCLPPDQRRNLSSTAEGTVLAQCPKPAAKWDDGGVIKARFSLQARQLHNQRSAQRRARRKTQRVVHVNIYMGRTARGASAQTQAAQHGHTERQDHRMW